MRKKQQRTERIENRVDAPIPVQPPKTYKLVLNTGAEYLITATGHEDLTSQCLEAVYNAGLSYPLGMASLDEIKE